MKVRVEKDICIGCGVCAEIAAGSFMMNGDKAEASGIDNLTDKVVQESVKLARDVCPVQAIVVEEN